MDKRWIGILIILIIGCCCMYFIVSSSDTVGTAITDVNKTVVTLPHGFSIGDDDKGSVTLVSKHSDEKIHIKDLGKNDTAKKSCDEKLYELNHDSNMNVLKNYTSNISNFNVYRIDFEDLSKENVTNVSSAYIYTCNHTFLIKMYNYNNQTGLDDDLTFIINTLRPDFKQSQD